MLGPVEQQVHVAVGEVAGQQVEAIEVGALDGLVQPAGAPDEGLAAALDPSPDPEHVGRSGLRVQVPQQRAETVLGGQVAEVDGRGRLAHAALDVVGGDHLHPLSPAVSAAIR
jgi:hypothetical protein